MALSASRQRGKIYQRKEGNTMKTTTKLLSLIMAAVMLTAALSACGSKENTGGRLGDFVVGGTSSGEPTDSKPPSGNSSQTHGDTSGTAQPPQSDAPTKQPTAPLSVDDPASVKALAGSWFFKGTSESCAWVFSSDGIFATGFTSNSRAPEAYSTTGTYEYTIKGKYRVNDYEIECYDCQISSTFKQGMSGKYLTSDEAAKLLNAQLDKPVKCNNFTIQFEFYDAMNLRIVYNRIASDSYDTIIPYNGTSHNVTVSTQLIPSKSWPKDLLPSDFPEYGTGGRVKDIVKEKTGNVMIYIDMTTLDAYVDYCNRLLQAGWSFSYSTETIEEVKKGYLVSLKKGDQQLMVNGPTNNDYKYGTIRIIFYP